MKTTGRRRRRSLCQTQGQAPGSGPRAQESDITPVWCGPTAGALMSVWEGFKLRGLAQIRLGFSASGKKKKKRDWTLSLHYGTCWERRIKVNADERRTWNTEFTCCILSDTQGEFEPQWTMGHRLLRRLDFKSTAWHIFIFQGTSAHQYYPFLCHRSSSRKRFHIVTHDTDLTSVVVAHFAIWDVK